MEIAPLELVTAPSGRVLELTEVKRHLRIDEAQNSENTLLNNLLATAEDFVADEIPGCRQLLSATYDLRVSDWWERLTMPRPPLASVASVKYYDADGTLTTLATDQYIVRTPWKQPGTIERAPDVIWPTYQTDRQFPIVVRFICGYGTGDSVPRKLKQAILLLVGHWYKQREAYAVEPGVVTAEVPMGVRRLLESESWGYYG